MYIFSHHLAEFILFACLNHCMLSVKIICVLWLITAVLIIDHAVLFLLFLSWKLGYVWEGDGLRIWKKYQVWGFPSPTSYVRASSKLYSLHILFVCFCEVTGCSDWVFEVLNECSNTKIWLKFGGMLLTSKVLPPKYSYNLCQNRFFLFL